MDGLWQVSLMDLCCLHMYVGNRTGALKELIIRWIKHEMFSVIQQRRVMLIIFFFIPTMMNYYLSNSSPCWQMSTITTTHVLQMMDLSTYLSFYSFIVFDEPIFYALHLFFNSGPRTWILICLFLQKRYDVQLWMRFVV